jgi:hypothetical protein
MGAPVAAMTSGERFGADMLAPSRYAKLARRLRADQVAVSEGIRALVEALPRVVERERQLLADAVAERVAERLTAAPSSVPFLAGYPEAARLLSTTVSALKTRVSRGDPRLHAAMVTNGKSVRFNVAKLFEKFKPKRTP